MQCNSTCPQAPPGSGHKRDPTARLLRLGLSVASWAVAFSIIQGLLQPDIGRSLRPIEERIELRLQRLPVDTPTTQPERSHEEEPIDSWELVGV